MEANTEKSRTLRCKSSTDANKLAGSIASIYQENPETKQIIRVIGAGALNQAVKASIISNKYFGKKGLSVALMPSFQEAGEGVTVIELRVLFCRN